MCGVVLRHASPRREKRGAWGFTLFELLIALAIMAIVIAVAIPAFSSLYGDVCLKAAVWEIGQMIKEGKQRGLEETDYALCFNPTAGEVTLVSGRGPDGEWNTTDDPVVRALFLSTKGGGLKFGTGGHGPYQAGRADPEDGISFATPENVMVCNTRLTGNGGTIYVQSASGGAMALVVNSKDFSYSTWRWSGKQWVKL